MKDLIIFRLDGRYFGFVRGGNLFRGNGDYYGWVDRAERVWRADGYYIGEIVEENYVLRSIAGPNYGRQVPRRPPTRPVPPVPQVDRVYKIGMLGWIDSLHHEDNRGTLNYFVRITEDQKTETQTEENQLE